MRRDQFKLRLQPEPDSSFTRLRLSGSVLTALPPCEMKRWIRQLSTWSDSPVALVLPVDVGSAEWFELWTYAITDIPARHLQVHFSLQRRPLRQGGRDAI